MIAGIYTPTEAMNSQNTRMLFLPMHFWNTPQWWSNPRQQRLQYTQCFVPLDL